MFRRGHRTHSRSTIPTDTARRTVPLPLLLVWLYPVALAALALARWCLTGNPGVLSGWLLLPAQCVQAAVTWRMLGAVALSPWRRRAWLLMLAATLLDVIANAMWTYLADTHTVLYGSVADFVFDLNYAALIGACACLYKSRGGRFASKRVVADAATLALGVCASLLPFLFSPVFGTDAGWAQRLTSIGYTAGIGATTIMAGLLYMQVMDWREERAIAWLLGGIALVVTGDLCTAAANIRGDYLIGGADVVVSALVYTMFTCAAYAQYRPAAESGVAPSANLHGFLPILSLFVAIAIVLGAEFGQASGNVVVAATLALVAAVLLVVRQFSVRYEIERLNAALAERAAEQRASELVRRSSDVIAVCDADHRIRFVSPASLAMLGHAPERVIGEPAEALFGVEHVGVVRDFLAGARGGDGVPPATELELCLLVRDERRVVNLTISDESGNRLIGGAVLTVRDLTAQRALESALLDIATRERQRLCGDIHEGLGQQLTGIGLYLTSMNVARSRGRAVTGENLEPVIGLVNAAVDQVRALARGLSPLEVVHRSLESALRALAQEVERQFATRIRLSADIDADVLGDLESDHLYRVIQEAVLNACRHGRASGVDIEVSVRRERIALVVADDGVGLAENALAKDHLGLRMMRYRVQLLGGTVRFESAPGRGTRVVIRATRHRPGAAA